MSDKPLCIDLYAGLGGWSEAFLAEGYRCVGYDIEAHDYGTGGYPGELILRDVRSIHGSEFKDAAIIVASPPCQRYSYMAMPWSRAKAQIAMIEADTTGDELRKLNLLFDTCFRIQREASEAAGHHIPMIVENVRGAQRWVGPSKYNYGSYHFWGDVPALMPIPAKVTEAKQGSCKRLPGAQGGRISGWPHTAVKDDAVGNKMGGDWFSDPTSTCRRHGSKSKARKAASAMIAKIPFPLAVHIARTFKPEAAQ
jgi:hypothetical protein